MAQIDELFLLIGKGFTLKVDLSKNKELQSFGLSFVNNIFFKLWMNFVSISFG